MHKKTETRILPGGPVRVVALKTVFVVGYILGEVLHTSGYTVGYMAT